MSSLEQKPSIINVLDLLTEQFIVISGQFVTYVAMSKNYIIVNININLIYRGINNNFL